MTDQFNELPSNYYISGKKLWCGDIGIDIDHTGDGMPNNQLDYQKAISKMVAALEKKEMIFIGKFVWTIKKNGLKSKKEANDFIESI